jgi:hypothetical protein
MLSVRTGLARGIIAIVLVAWPGVVGAVDPGTIEALRRDFEAMKRRLAGIEELTRKQEEIIRRQGELIEKLGGGKAPAVTGVGAAAAPPSPAAEDEERLKKQVTENVLRRIQPSLAAANRTFPSQFNPAIGLIIDTAASYSSKDRANFDFRSAEVGLSASVDPFVRGYAILTGTADEFEVDEAAIVTTSLPYNLTAKGGRFFADFGRLSKFHDHDLPFVNRPIVLDTYVGGEAQADGAEVSYLVPIPYYLNLTAGAYNKIGGENERVDNTVPRDYSQFTYLGRGATFLNLADANSIDLGASLAGTPEVKIDNGSPRYLAGLDLTYRYTPLGQAGYRGLIWGTELLYNQEHRPIGGFPEEEESDTPLVFKRRDAFGLYSYVEARVTRRFYPGFLYQWVEDIDDVTGDTQAFSPYLTVWASEFQRLRLQYTRLQAPGSDNKDNQFFLQWTVVLGSHAHTFRDR